MERDLSVERENIAALVAKRDLSPMSILVQL